MTTLFYFHDSFLAHDTGSGHPESPARLQAILSALEEPELAPLSRRTAPAVALEDLQRVHTEAHVRAVLAAIPQVGHAWLDSDTVVSARSGEAALHAAGAACAAVDAIMAGEGRNAFCAVRPPGHHAEPDRAMGFCLFNNVAVAARHAQAAHGIRRVAIIDFDVHHGNGTQAVFAADPSVFYGSTHQWPWYPGTGAASETGAGNIVNAPLPAGSGSAAFRAAMAGRILPAADAFRPELVLVSAGFDAHRLDPLANLGLDEADYVWVTDQLLALAGRWAAGRLVSLLEGGYHIPSLKKCVGLHIERLINWTAAPAPGQVATAP